MASVGVEVRSYRAVFDLERRIYRIDTVRLHPGGVPLRGIAYFAALVAVTLLVSQLPLRGLGLGLLPWYLRYGGLPAAAAALFTITRIDGRPFHRAATALIAQRLGPRQFAGLRPCRPIGVRWRPPAIVLIPDGSDAGLRRFRFTGPGVVVVGCAHRRAEWPRRALARPLRRPDITMHPAGEGARLSRPIALELRPGAMLEVRPTSSRP